MTTSLGEGPQASHTGWIQVVACLGSRRDLLTFPQTIALPLTVPVIRQGSYNLEVCRDWHLG